MWAGALTLLIGDQLIGIRFDSDEGLALARTLLHHWVDESPEQIRPAFSVRLSDPRHSPRGGAPVAVPQVQFGARTIMRSRDPAQVLEALVSILGGVHVHQPDDGQIWLGLRPFVRDGVAVLVGARPPMLLGDRDLAARGITEASCWTTVITPDSAVLVPPPLPEIDWAGAQLVPPATVNDWQRYELAGIVVDEHHEPSPGELVVRAASTGTAPGWFPIVQSLVEAGRVAPGSTRREIREQLQLLFAMH